MLPLRVISIICLLPICIAVHASERSGDSLPSAEQSSHFEQKIRPVLVQQCIQCHGQSKQEGSLRLDSREYLLSGGDSGPAIAIGLAQESLLIEALHHQGFEMPPTGKLPERTIAQFERWIADGAIWPDSPHLLRQNALLISEEDRQWWAFQPILEIAPPLDPNDLWSLTDVDRFVWQKLAEKEMQPASLASKEILVRRLYYGLIGLPPSPEEIDSFLEDASPTAYQSLIDRLLEDKRYGEHWARFWLDLVRYSESDGWNKDSYRPHLWRYRDYVIDAFNNDLPYPRFVLDQLAGDELEGDDPGRLVATGFLRLGV